MKKHKRYLSLFLSIALLICTLGTAPAFAARDSRVGYIITGSEKDGEFVLDVSLRNVRALAGKLAISFDSSKLQLKSTSPLGSAVKIAEGLYITSEGLDHSVLISNEKGYVMFAWYAAGNSAIDATSSERDVASISFTFNNGATVDDFNRNTIGLYYVNQTMVDKWTCSANIISDNLMAYRNTSFNEDYLCDINYDYPNSDVIPIETYTAGVKVRDTDGNPLSGALVSLDGLEAETDGTGYVSYEMENGVYPYRVSLSDYEAKSGYIIIDGEPADVSVELNSYAQLVQNIADNLTLGFADGDNADSVTTSIGLPDTGMYNETITWQSSNESVVTSQGIVNRSNNDIKVRLTATVTYGTASAVHTFEITVKGRQTAEEKNMAIVLSDIEALDIGYAPGDTASSVTTSLTLPGIGQNGSAIVWTSSNEEIVDNYGSVIRPTADTAVKLTARVMRGTANLTKEFTVTVLGQKEVDPDKPTPPSSDNDSEIVDKVLSALEIGFSKGDSAENVTKSLTLPTVGVEETPITWESSKPAVVTAYGGVVRQATNSSVTLTATVTKGSVSKQKTFTVVVLAAPAIPLNPGNGQEAEIIKNNNSNSSKPNNNGQDKTDVDDNKNPEVVGRFHDISNVKWAHEAILSLTERGAIKGTSDTTFSPQESILRRDFITIFMRMMNLEGEVSDTFDDVAPGEYYYEPIALAKSLGIISGVGDNKFNPNGYITRQDMITITYRALVKLEMANFEAADLSVFGDRESVADYAYESVSNLVGAGYIQGDDLGNLNPTANTTRAEAAVFLYRLGI